MFNVSMTTIHNLVLSEICMVTVLTEKDLRQIIFDAIYGRRHKHNIEFTGTPSYSAAVDLVFNTLIENLNKLIINDVFGNAQMLYFHPDSTVKVKMNISTICLAMVIYFEARSETEIVQRHVAQIPINRSIENDTHLCDEVWRPHQFKWTTRVKRPGSANLEYLTSRPFMKQYKIRESDPWANSLELAVTITTNYRKVNDALFFHSSAHAPWTRGLKFVGRIGKFKFYKEG